MALLLALNRDDVGNGEIAIVPIPIVFHAVYVDGERVGNGGREIGQAVVAEGSAGKGDCEDE